MAEDYKQLIKKQILGQGLTSKWSGAGFGSAEANAEDMAKILADIGITDIKQFGKVDKYEPIEQIGMTFNGQPVRGSGSEFYVMDAVDTGDGTDYVRRDLSPEEAQQVKPVYGVPTGYDENTQPTYKTVDIKNIKEKDGQLFGATGETFGNKLTGQEVPVTYGGRQGGEFFGGTYEGKGNTGYGVQFDDQGNPIFYTQGASSSDLDKFAPLLTIASFVPGLAPFAQGLNALIAAKQGNVLGAVAGAAGLGSMAGISGMADIANAAKFAGALKSGDPLAIAMAGANAGGISDVGGFDLKDISKTIGAVKAIESGDPLAILRYGMDAIPKSGGLTASLGPGDMDEFRANLIPGYFSPGGGGYTQKEVTTPLGPTEEFDPQETDWGSFYKNVGGEGVNESNLSNLSPEDRAKYEAMKAGDTSSIDALMKLPGQEMQIDPTNWNSYNQNLINIVNNKGGYTSQWQTVDGDRVMINDDGTGIGTNENGDPYSLSPSEVNSMIKNGVLNTAQSGYVAATGGTGNTPGGSGKPAPAKPAARPAATARPATSGANPAVDAIANLANQQQQQQNSLLNMMMSDKTEGAKIKSYKELFGEDLFGNSYIPPSALGASDGFSGMPLQVMQQEQQEQNDGDGGFSNGGRVNSTDVDTLLQILRG